MPSKAGAQALADLQEIRYDLGRQAVIDFAIITALSALRHQGWTPPVPFGRNRDVWRLPPDLQSISPTSQETRQDITGICRRVHQT